MSHVRCFAHAFVTAVALVSWGGAAYIGIWHGAADDPYRFLGLVLLILAGTTTVLAAAPVVWFAYIRQHTDLLGTKAALEAAWNLGCATGRRQEQRKRAALYEQHPSLSVVRRD